MNFLDEETFKSLPFEQQIEITLTEMCEEIEDLRIRMQKLEDWREVPTSGGVQ